MLLTLSFILRMLSMCHAVQTLSEAYLTVN